MRSALSVLTATLFVAAGTGCSEDKQAQAPATTSASTTTPVVTRPKPAPHRSRWVRQVDHVCKPWQDRIDAVSPQPTDTASLQPWLEETLPLVRKQIAAVKAVKPPVKAGEARKVRLFLDSLQTTERALRRYLEATEAHAPAQERSALAEASASGAAARAHAMSLNITQCGGYSSG